MYRGEPRVMATPTLQPTLLFQKVKKNLRNLAQNP